MADSAAVLSPLGDDVVSVLSLLQSYYTFVVVGTIIIIIAIAIISKRSDLVRLYLLSPEGGKINLGVFLRRCFIF